MGDVIYGWPVIQNSRSLGGFHILRHREGVTKIVTFLNKLISKIDDKGGGGGVKNIEKLRDIICGSPLMLA